MATALEEDLIGDLAPEDPHFDFFDLNSLCSFDETIPEELAQNMTSLGSFMLLGPSAIRNRSTNEISDEDDKLKRLSLAYEKFHTMPKLLLQEHPSYVEILDISYNQFENLDFLITFKNLTTLVCDHNEITSKTTIPYLPKLELLWMNHCKIDSLYPWVKKLQLSCPNLKFLSLMGNPVAPTFHNADNYYEYLQYRLFLISSFPKLIYLDEKQVTEDQRIEAEKIYHRPLVERLVMNTHSSLPPYLRHICETVSQIVSTPPAFAVPPKNVII